MCIFDVNGRNPHSSPIPSFCSGYFAKVYLGEDKETHEKVAVKAIEKKMVEDPASLENEINILKKVDHPLIVKMKAVFDTKEKLYIVLEL
jgi:serine/threonine protein kinase